jgi:hypothetical protein
MLSKFRKLEINPADPRSHVHLFIHNRPSAGVTQTGINQFIQSLGIPGGQFSVKSRNTCNPKPTVIRSRVILAYPK